MQTLPLRHLLLLAVAALPCAAQTITNLGLPPGWPSTTWTTFGGVSSGGDAVTGSLASNASNGRPFRWTPAGGMQILGAFPGSGGEAYGVAIAADGNTIAGYGYATQGTRAFRWTATGGMSDLGTLPGRSASSAAAMSDDGTAIAGYCWTTGVLDHRASLWTGAAGWQDLGVLPGATRSQAQGISGDGRVVVGQSWHPGNMRAFHWTAATGLQDLGLLPGMSWARAEDVNGDGTVVVGASGDHAFRWTAATGMQDLGVLPGMIWSSAEFVSTDGAIVLGRSGNGGGSQPFLWTPSLGMVDLPALLSSRGVDLTGWTGVSLNGGYCHKAISPDGNALVGNGLFNGNQRSWVVRDLWAHFGRWIPFGSGCGTPALGFQGVARPVLGTTAIAETTSVPAGSTGGFLLFGLTAIEPGLDLGVIGMPGCFLNVTMEFAPAPFASGGGTVLHPLPVPNMPALAGLPLHLQSVAHSPGTNAFGFLSSNGLRAILDVQ